MFRTRAPQPLPPQGWWTNPVYVALLVLIAAIPLIWPTTPPLTDLMGHMGRYRVEIADPASPLLTRYYGFKWAIMGNLGVDLLVVPMAKLFGLELGVKLIVLAIPPLTAAGMLMVAREAHGRLPATAVFALPLVYSYPLQWGFVNFMLAMAFALIAFGWWLKLGRTGRTRLRAWLFVPVAALIWLAHGFGWGVLGLLAFSAEYVRWRGLGKGWIAAAWHAGLACLPLAPPLLLMLAWRSGNVGGETGDWFNWSAKYVYLISILRNHHQQLDLGHATLLAMFVAIGLFGIVFRMNRTLGLAAVVLIVTYVLLPRILLGSAYADMRLAPFMVAIAVLALVPKDSGRVMLNVFAGLALLLYVGRIAISTDAFVRIDRDHQAQLAAVDHIARGSRVFVLADLPCLGQWDSPRLDHLGGMAIVRKEAFVNGQWTMAGAQLLTIRYAPAKGFAEDPTQVIRPRTCRNRRARDFDWSVAHFPRDAFDYLWLINAPPYRWPREPDLRLVWHGAERGALYRIVGSASATAASDTPNGSERAATQ